MIRPLRDWHRRIVFALAGVLPLTFVAGLLARKAPAARNSSVVWTAGSAIRWKSAAPIRLGTADVRARRSEDGKWLEFLGGGELLEPDVLVYSSASALAGNTLPPDARLLGSFAARRMRTDAAGHVVIYSLAHQNIIGGLRLGDLP